MWDFGLEYLGFYRDDRKGSGLLAYNRVYAGVLCWGLGFRIQGLSFSLFSM